MTPEPDSYAKTVQKGSVLGIAVLLVVCAVVFLVGVLLDKLG